jgi:hypothetical protein
MTYEDKIAAAMKILACAPKANFPDPCEWDPIYKRAVYLGDDHASADLIVGSNGEWRLCAECAKLPEFKHFRRVKPISRVATER